MLHLQNLQVDLHLRRLKLQNRLLLWLEPEELFQRLLVEHQSLHLHLPAWRQRHPRQEEWQSREQLLITIVAGRLWRLRR